jgi:hypothetical protein
MFKKPADVVTGIDSHPVLVNDFSRIEELRYPNAQLSKF